MKKTVLLLGLITSSAMFAQVGINTPTPTSTLDVTAKNATGTTTNTDGLLVPRVDRQRAQSMTGTPTSTLIYVNSIATGTAAGTTVNVDAVGYYYFNGTVWVKLHNPANIPNIGVNIYNADGTLTGNRTVIQGANTLTFNSTAINGFSVDSNTFSVDAAGNQVGIGTTTPGEKLDVKGAITYVGQAVANKTGAASIDYAASTIPAQARILSWGPDATTNGIISFWTGLGGATANEKMRVHSNGNVGIGTTTPQRLLHVNGALQVTNELNVGGNATTAGSAGTTGQVLISNGAGAAPSWQNASAASVNIYNADGTLTGNRTVTQGANTLTFNSTATNGFSVDGNTFSVDAANNRIGVGTTAPGGIVDVVSDNTGSAAGNDFYFTGYGTSKAPGLFLGSANGTLAAPTNLANGDQIGGVYFNPRINGSFNFTTGAAMLSTYRGDGVTGLTDLQFRTSNNDRMKIDEIGNVGIGTTAPARLLHVAGNARITGSIGTPTGLMGRDATGDIGSITLGSGLSLTGGTLSSTATSTNIYNTDGTLTTNRVVTQGANTLTFNTTATNGFAVARTGLGYILSVDGVNSRVGIGTTTPTNKLEINNGTTAGAIKIVDGTQGTNKVLTSDANGVGTWNSLAGSWFGLLRLGSSNALGPIDFGFGSVVGQGGSANPATDTITVPTTGLYEITISGWSQNGAGSPYLTTWDLARNGSTLGNPHYASPSQSYGTETSVTNYYNLNAGDSIKLGLGNPFASPFPANTSQRVSLAVKLIQ